MDFNGLQGKFSSLFRLEFQYSEATVESKKTVKKE